MLIYSLFTSCNKISDLRCRNSNEINCSNKNMQFFLQKKLKNLAETKLKATKTYLEKLDEELKKSKNYEDISHKVPKLTEITTDENHTSLLLSKEELGFHTWTLLHSYASAYPLKADFKDQFIFKNLIDTM